jgi:hypothetical protein
MTHTGPEGTTSSNNSRRGKEMIRAHLTLVHVFHAYASVDTPWVAHALSHCTPVRYGRIASVSAAHYSVWGFHMSHMR